MAKSMLRNQSSIYAENHIPSHTYDLLDSYDAGLVLAGPETKAIKTGVVALRGSYIHLRAGNAWLEHAAIGPYAPAAHNNMDKYRPRQLLLKKDELRCLVGSLSAKGLTALPRSLYSKAGRIKLNFVVVRRKKTVDRRAKIAKKELKRTIKTLEH